jgi:hypothetical protein
MTGLSCALSFLQSLVVTKGTAQWHAECFAALVLAPDSTLRVLPE